ncbi:uncharacterized protein DDB_G0283697-like [Lolium rigidum]|uniref:uncharacterized protein DDB_G0283697-like n=1 Tax=Lolium rigidum TaxID=89674 RepID=UPI001F5DD595|nr:uncharacterized protein DDB_G0283697-like [Lolium rigidum]
MGTGRRRGVVGDDSDEEYLIEDEEELCVSSAAEEGGGSDAEYQVDEEDGEEEETPRPVKGAGKRKPNPAPVRSRGRRRYEDDDDYSEEEVEEDEGAGEQYQEEDPQEAEEPPRLHGECGARGQPPVIQRSNRRRREEDADFDPDLDEGEEDRDMDFDPELEGDNDECEEEEFNLSRTRKTQQRITNTVRRRIPASKRRRGTKRKSSSKGSKRKARAAKPRKAAPAARRRRKRPAIERYEDDDDDFIVDDDDQVEVSRNPRKKARFGRQDRPVPVAEADIWPAVDSDTSDFEFGTSDEDAEAPVVEPVRVAARKGRRKKAAGSSSDSEFHVSDEELRVVREEEVTRKKRALVLQSDSDSEYHVSDTQLEASRETASKKCVSSSDSEFNLSDKELGHVRKETKKKKKHRVFVSGSSSESEFHVSDKELGHVRKEAKKKKNNRAFVSGSSSESEFHVSDKDLGCVREGEAKRKKRVFVSGSSSDSECHASDKDSGDKPLEAQPTLPVSVRRISLARNGEDKGKEKKEAVDAGKQTCGICFSEDQRMTPQGMLNCCSHYFCFPCIMEWSKVESKCPLCKRRFTTITKSSKVDLGLELKKTVIRVEERDQVYQPTEEEIRRWLDPYENLVCIECNQGGEDSLMLLCDICDSSAHTYCVGLGREVPEGNWYCGGCRLAGEGPSYPRRLTNSNSAQVAATAPIGIFERSPSINSWQTFQGFDLNASPRESSRQNHPAESQASTAGVSTPSGGRLATLSRRRGWMRILLNRHRPSDGLDLGHNGVQNSDGAARAEPDRMNFFASSDSNSLQHSGYVSRIEQTHINLHAPLEANSSQLLLDDIRDQHRFSPSVHTPRNSTPCISVDGNSFPTN